MKTDTFSGFHPVVNLVFFAAVLGLTMLVMQPVCLMLSLLSGCAYGCYLHGPREMGRQLRGMLPLAVTMAVLNPLFNHEGLTILGYLPNDNPVTLEAIVYGAAAAVLLLASLVWFDCCNVVFTSDKTLYLFGRVIPALSLLLSMTLRFVPRFKAHLRQVYQAQQNLSPPGNAGQKLRQALTAFSATVSWAMEQSIVTADAMKSRGYGLMGRTAYAIYRFDRRDAVVMLILAMLIGGEVVLCLRGCLAWRYYPSLTGTLTEPLQWAAYLCSGGLYLLPLWIDLTEDWKWNYLKSRI